METLHREMVIGAGGKLTLSGLPYKKGEAVEVVVRPKVDRKKLVRRLKALFRRTQALPRAKTITDTEILAEIADHRAGR